MDTASFSGEELLAVALELGVDLSFYDLSKIKAENLKGLILTRVGLGGGKEESKKAPSIIETLMNLPISSRIGYPTREGSFCYLRLGDYWHDPKLHQELLTFSQSLGIPQETKKFFDLNYRSTIPCKGHWEYKFRNIELLHITLRCSSISPKLINQPISFEILGAEQFPNDNMSRPSGLFASGKVYILQWYALKVRLVDVAQVGIECPFACHISFGAYTAECVG